MEREKVLCPLRTADGKQCGFELLPNFKWCPDCAGQVDKAWFQSEGMYSKQHIEIYIIKGKCSLN